MVRSIPFHDFGGDGPLLHFAHPNAYTPTTFRRFLRALTPDYHVLAMRHRPLWPDTQPEELADWRLITDDLLRFLDQQGIEQVIGMGHSLGGVVTMYAAVEQPERFRALVLIEPVFLPPHVLNMARDNPDAMALMPLVQSARRRRNRWPSYQAAFDHFRLKDVFRYWSDEALWDYVNESLHEDETGDVVLTFSREWEARFYSLPPQEVWDALPQVEPPTLAIRAAETDTIFPEAWQLWQEKQPEATFVEIESATHMVPMEKPRELAQIVRDYLATELHRGDTERQRE